MRVKRYAQSTEWFSTPTGKTLTRQIRCPLLAPFVKYLRRLESSIILPHFSHHAVYRSDRLRADRRRGCGACTSARSGAVSSDMGQNNLRISVARLNLGRFTQRARPSRHTIHNNSNCPVFFQKQLEQRMGQSFTLQRERKNVS